MQARCGTRAAIIAHLEYGEPLDGPCAAADAAMRMDAERPHRRYTGAEDTPEMCEQRREILEREVVAWEANHRGFDEKRRSKSLRSVATA